ncbi:MAG TPA: class I SAM-dependent methyltransferase [Pseudolabrys sp.]|nr:class I SAM-dependent methyltransferase [Pseudolabrys sp.]
MDQTTLAVYDSDASTFVQRWLTEEEPADVYALLRKFFRPGLTADIGSGSGRDAAWLTANGYPAIGYDLSEALLAQARARFPHIEFKKAALPDLSGVPARHFDNVVCETVLMHLPSEEIAPAVARMLEILKPGGVIYMSFRITENADHREKDGRLFTAYVGDHVRRALAGQAILFDGTVERRPGVMHQRLIARVA